MHHVEDTDASLLKGMEAFHDIEDVFDYDCIDDFEMRARHIIEDINFEISQDGHVGVPSIEEVTFQSTGLDEVYGVGWQSSLR